MLVLSRRQGERIMVGDNIEITVIRTRGERVRLGFTAPADVRIQRREVARRVEEAEALVREREQLSTAVGVVGIARDPNLPLAPQSVED